jgi:hypothetical protein
MSTVNYRYEQSYSFKKKGVKNTIREQVIDGKIGLSIMYLKKEGDDNFYKIYVKEDEKNKNQFILKEKKNNDAETEKTITDKDLAKMLKSLKLDSISNYVTNERGTYKGKKITKKITKITNKKINKLA